ncbi:hypothetical protein CA884_01310 [Salmonella enterica]|nr:hypothetical protein [Salmonella enterica]EBR7012247.1 hypothetical protein [Salmonella enterica]ECX9182792.1 hypothetical protein [Salmonella enterica]EEI2489650.1 hypothetical protein [Salmonella enterica]EHA6021915.1 hypothetical protein [Salmonella enterica]
MYYIDNNSGSPNMPPLSPAQSNTPTWFTEGDKNKGISWIGQDWLNILQAELLNILSEAGIKPDKGKLNQLTLSIKAIITANAYTQANNLKEIFDAGVEAQAAARGHLGLGKLATKDSLGPADVNALAKDQNLNDVPNKALARTALQLGNSATLNVGTTANTVAAGDDSRITGAMQKSQNGADIPNKPLFLQNVGLTETVEQARNAVPSTRKVNGKALTTDITLTSGDIGALPVTGGKLNGPLGIGTDNALGGNSIVFGDNDTGFKWHSDGVLGIYANNALVGYIDNSGLHMSVDVLSNGAIRAGNGKKLSLTSTNNSALNAGFNLWGDANRPTVIELDDDQGWHLYSQRNPDGSIVFTVNGDITANTLRAGEAIYQNNGDIFGSAWGGWLSNWVNNNFVRAVRLGPQAISGGLWRDYQLGGGNVVTGFHTDGSWEMEGDDDKVYYRPVQFLVGGTWITASSV